MFWAGEKIQKAIEEQRLVFVEDGSSKSCFDIRRIDCNAYTLCVGEEYFVTTDKQSRSLPLAGVQPFSGNYSRSIGTIIPPGQFAFLLTLESVTTPKSAMGFISLKTKAAKFKGLVNVSGFHVDPGYTGKLIFAVFNAGPSPIHIRYGEVLFNLWVADIDTGDSNSPITEHHYKKSPINHIPSEIVTEVADRLSSIQDLATRMNMIESKLNGFLFIASVTAAIVAFLGGFGPFLALFSSNN